MSLTEFTIQAQDSLSVNINLTNLKNLSLVGRLFNYECPALWPLFRGARANGRNCIVAFELTMRYKRHCIWFPSYSCDVQLYATSPMTSNREKELWLNGYYSDSQSNRFTLLILSLFVVWFFLSCVKRKLKMCMECTCAVAQ